MLEKLQKHWQRIAVTLLPLVLALIHASGLQPLSYLKRLDELYYDTRLRLTMPSTMEDKVVIVDVDEKSLAQIGRWPWSRDKVAALVDTVMQQQRAAVLGFDILFSEADTSSGLAVLEQLASNEMAANAEFVAKVDSLKTQLNYDARLAQALQGRRVVLGYYFSSDREGQQHGQLPAAVMQKKDLQGREIRFTSWDGYGANLPLLAQAAPMAGFFNSLTSADGVVRSVPLLVEFKGEYYESLPLAMFRSYTGFPSIRPSFPPERFLGRAYQSLDGLLLAQGDKALRIPVDDTVSALVPFRGRGGVQGGSYQYYSAVDVLAGKIPANALRDKLVLLGTTAPGLLDLRVAPVGETYPGVEVHANMLSGFLSGTIPVRPDYAIGFEVVLLLLVGLFLGFSLPLLSAPRAVALEVVVLAAVLFLNTWLYVQEGLVLPIASVLLMAVTAFALNMIYGYFVESRSKRQLAGIFRSYVPPQLVNEMMKDPSRYSMEAANKELTVMFCDMRGFTKMSERMDPTEVQALLNTVFGRLTHIIGEHQGTIDKYMGDCVMAFWGAPVEFVNHSEKALQAALKMQEEMVAMNRNRTGDAPPMAVSIALTTGLMCVGNMGTTDRQAYTVIGDAVNLCARLEPLSRIYGVDLIVSESTRRQNPNYLWQELDSIQVKGKDDSERIFTPRALGSNASEEVGKELKIWEQVLKAYRAARWDEAQMHLLNLTRTAPERRLYQLYAERLQSLRNQQDAQSWTGVWVFDHK